jgi:hypothetical protein
MPSQHASTRWRRSVGTTLVIRQKPASRQQDEQCRAREIEHREGIRACPPGDHAEQVEEDRQMARPGAPS